MTTEKTYGKKIIETEYGQIKVTRKFKYPGETICNNGSEKEHVRENHKVGKTKLRNKQYLQ